MYLSNLYQDFGPDETQVIADLKRLVERYKGDPEFRRVAVEYPIQRADLLVDIGIVLDCSTWECLWKHLEDGRQFPLMDSDWAAHPELRIFRDWKRSYQQHFSQLNDRLSAVGNRRLVAWRQRNIQRFRSEITGGEQAVIFPLFAYELSKGCSVGCWFCGFSAERLQGYFPYTSENARLWQDILYAEREWFGPANQFPLCYHGTEPFDNPDYFLFLHDYFACHGIYPQTTTALPLKALSMSREMIRLRETSPILPDRFSVLTLGILRKIHQTFSPFELRHVELVLQNPGAVTFKTGSGRAKLHPQKVAASNQIAGQYYPASAQQDPLTNECLCGYLVNMVDRSVKLITPCPSSDQWPNGYRVHAEGTFRDASEYRAFLERTIEECMPEKPAWDKWISFRPDLAFARVEEGFTLTSRSRRHALTGKPWYGLLGDLIASGEASVMEITRRLAPEGAPLPEVTSIINQIFDQGLLKQQ